MRRRLDQLDEQARAGILEHLRRGHTPEAVDRRWFLEPGVAAALAAEADPLDPEPDPPASPSVRLNVEERAEDERLLRALSLRDHHGLSAEQIALELGGTRNTWAGRMARVDQALARTVVKTATQIYDRARYGRDRGGDPLAISA